MTRLRLSGLISSFLRKKVMKLIPVKTGMILSILSGKIPMILFFSMNICPD